jgi:hypothetical protein
MKQFTFALLSVFVVLPAAWGGCHCDSGHSVVHGAVMASPIMTGGHMATRHMRILPAAPMVAPPPGTLGETYSRVSHPIPEDEHPRTAMLAVRDQKAVKYLRVQRMGGFQMKNGIWLFESARPLFPGQDHVVRVEARHDTADIEPYQVKFVRLIPGRIVYLDF